jgi:hypothetical protein
MAQSLLPPELYQEIWDRVDESHASGQTSPIALSVNGAGVQRPTNPA